MNIQIINGPNINLLGKREPDIYGNKSFEEYLKELQLFFTELKIGYFQSNTEGDVINELHRVGYSYDGIVINAGAYTHTSLAIADAIAGIKTPVIEVHISNVYAREEIRHHSLIASGCKGSIVGFGLYSYHLALTAFQHK